MQDPNEIMEYLLPEKSRDAYKKVYQKFLIWKEQKGAGDITEMVILNYLQDQSEHVAPSSMWSYCSMIKACLIAFENIDIGRFPKVKALLKQKSRGYRSKKSKVLNREEVLRFFEEAPDEIYLLVKTILVVDIAGGCRIAELTNMKIDDIDDRGSVMVVTLPDTKTNKPRVFTIINDTAVKTLDILKKYMELRPKNVAHKRLFLNYQNGKCTVQPIGENKIRKMPSLIASFLNLVDPQLYTGHSFRRTSASLLVNAGADILELKRHGGWSSTSVAENYIVDSVERKNQTCKKIFGSSSSTSIVDVSGISSCSRVALAPDIDTNIMPADNSADGFRTIVNNSTAGSTTTKFEPLTIQNCNIFMVNSGSVSDLSDLKNLMR